MSANLTTWSFCQVLLLVGCATLPTAARPTDVHPYLRAWLAAGLQEGSCDELNLAVQVLDRPAMDRVCPPRKKAPDGKCVPEPDGFCRVRLNGCISTAESGFEMTPKYWVLLNVSSAPPADQVRWRIAHEAGHALRRCAYGNADAGHKDRRVWNHYDEAKQVSVEGYETRAYEVTP